MIKTPTAQKLPPGYIEKSETNQWGAFSFFEPFLGDSRV